MADDQVKSPGRVAFLHTPFGIDEHQVDGEWPHGIVVGEWAYTWTPDLDGKPVVKVGRRSGVEFMHYDRRRRVAGDTAPLDMAKATLKGDDQDGDGPAAHDVGPLELGDKPGDERAEAPRRRSHFKRIGQGHEVQG